MQITQTFSWQATNWPTTTSPATQYSVFAIYPATTPIVVATVTTTSVTMTFDDSVPQAWQIRPSQTINDVTTYGPELTVFTIGVVPCRAWLRANVRIALSDRTDQATNTKPTWPDDELNTYIQEMINEFSLLFPLDASTTIQLLPPTIVNGVTQGTRSYPLPSNYYKIRQVEYIGVDQIQHLFLKYKPFIGGESTAMDYVGYPKLGILVVPVRGRYYAGNYDLFQGNIILDFDPVGTTDSLSLTYWAMHLIPQNDGDILDLLPQDLSIVSLGVQLKAWTSFLGQDTELSRWRDREDGSRRDDLPTIKQIAFMRTEYQNRIELRRQRMGRTFRLQRR
jgi:hypothetical protein